MFPESPDCTLYDDTKRNGFWVTGGEPGVIEVLKVWKWPIVHRSKFWPICFHRMQTYTCKMNCTRVNLHPITDIWSDKGHCAQFIRTAEFSHRLCTHNSESNISINTKRLGVMRFKKVYILSNSMCGLKQMGCATYFIWFFFFPHRLCTQILVRNNSETTKRMALRLMHEKEILHGTQHTKFEFDPGHIYYEYFDR